MVSKADRTVPNRILSEWRRRGAWGTVVTAASTIFFPVLRYRRRWIWEMKLSPCLPPSVWEPGQRLLILGPDNIASALTPALLDFLGGDAVAEELDGIMRGDRLFVLATDTEYLACSYVFFDTTRETRRQARIMGEPQNTPIIGMSFTAPAARGRGLYRKLLVEMFRFLASAGFNRAICEVRPENVASNRASHAAGMQLYRRLSDWAILERLFFQRVQESGRSRWRVVWVPK